MENTAGRLAFNLFKVAVFLGTGAMIGFFLGLAYASHLYGTPPVVAQIQNWLAGDSLYEGPLPADQATNLLNAQTNLMNSPVAIIPKIGACIGFGIAASVLSASLVLKAFFRAVKGNPSQETEGRDNENQANEKN